MRKLNFAEHELVARTAVTLASRQEGTLFDGIVRGYERIEKPLTSAEKKALSRKLNRRPRKFLTGCSPAMTFLKK